MHSRHRNPSVPAHYTSDMAITDTAVHDFDVVRWLLDEEIVAATVLMPRRSRHGGDLQDPLSCCWRPRAACSSTSRRR